MPGEVTEPSTVTDFEGQVGMAVIDGTGEAGDGSRLHCEVDLRFMRGNFVSLDGQRRHRALGFF